jgi:hypothetical protein
MDGIYLMHMLKQILEMFSTGMNTCIRLTSGQGSDAFKQPRYGMNLAGCILYAFPKLFPDNNNFGANQNFH